MIRYIYLTFLISGMVSSEPQCSSFDYEEKTLEKMIRTEILVEQVMSDIKQLKRETNDAVKYVENMKTELDDNIKNIHAANDAKFATYDSTITEWKDDLEIKPDVLFLSKDPTTHTPSTGSTIIFGTTIYDMSQSYDNTTGIFTAPVRGMYAFTTQMCLEIGTDKFIYYAIVANGQYVANSLAFDASHRFCNTAHAFVLLEKGETVFVQPRGVSSSALRLNNDREWCTFSGMLIH